MRVHLESIARQTGQMPEQLRDAPECPPLAAHVWGWFVELNAERDTDMNGAKRLTSKAIREWSDAVGAGVTAWERAALLAVDRIWMAPRD